MKIKQTILILVLIIGAGVALTDKEVSAASCGGVTTSVIQCKESGSCPTVNGVSVDPYEGTDPGSDAVKDATKIQTYFDTYHHKYGLCLNDVAPSTDIKDTGLWGVLLLAINILTAGIGIAAVGGIVYGSILYASAGGGPEQVKKAKEIIVNVVIGLVAYALMYAFLNFIIPGGLFA